MPVDRKLWTSSFSLNEIPLWPCPKCQHGHLKLLTKSLKSTYSAEATRFELVFYTFTEAGPTKNVQPVCEPGSIKGVFSCLFKCHDFTCDELISSCGTYTLGQAPPAGERNEIYFPLYFAPALPVFVIPT